MRSTTKPVTTGATIPARLTTKFWNPVHLPAARDPAIVWVMAHKFDPTIPCDITATISRTIEMAGGVMTFADQIEQQPGDQVVQKELGWGIGPEERGKQNAEFGGAQTQLVFQLRGGHRQVGSVDVVEKEGQPQEHEHANEGR